MKEMWQLNSFYFCIYIGKLHCFAIFQLLAKRGKKLFTHVTATPKVLYEYILMYIF